MEAEDVPVELGGRLVMDEGVWWGRRPHGCPGRPFCFCFLALGCICFGMGVILHHWELGTRIRIPAHYIGGWMAHELH